MSNSAFLREVSDQHGVSARRLAAALKTAKSELAIVAGLSPDALAKAARIGSMATQSLPSYGDATAEELVRQGGSNKVHAYLNRLNDGGYA